MSELDLRLLGEGDRILRGSEFDRYFDLVEERLILAEPLDVGVLLAIRRIVDGQVIFASQT